MLGAWIIVICILVCVWIFFSHTVSREQRLLNDLMARTEPSQKELEDQETHPDWSCVEIPEPDADFDYTEFDYDDEGLSNETK
ncbi:hypothetical protein THF5H11_20703 [Vibrio jasicida]|uniref:hypothetical protein n=1 Tax=Vibrio jasicida TaxID=766224 RepID=UPI002893B681|nr:hypothetical protein THF5H11_20703 [Vibrio jasicida]